MEGSQCERATSETNTADRSARSAELRSDPSSTSRGPATAPCTSTVWRRRAPDRQRPTTRRRLTLHPEEKRIDRWRHRRGAVEGQQAARDEVGITLVDDPV